MRFRILSIFLILALGAMAVFGFLSFGLIEQGGFHLCPFSAMSGGECPPAGNALASAIHHISGLQKLTQFIINIDPASLMLSVIMLVFVLLAFFKLAQKFVAERYALYFNRCVKEKLNSTIKRQLLYWFSLHNKRDPHAFCWVRDIL